MTPSNSSPDLQPGTHGPSIPVPLPFVLAALLIVLGAVPGWGVYLALPLSALTVAAAIWSCRPQLQRQNQAGTDAAGNRLRRLQWRAWRWALLGSLLWAGEELVWTASRLIFKTELIFLSDPLYYLGAVCWLVALLNMPQRATPRLSFLFALPALLFAVWLLLQNVGFAAVARFPLADLVLLLCALPALERAFYEGVPEGRLLWWAGLFVRVLAGALFIWLGDYVYAQDLFFFLWVFAYTFVALGAWLELSGVSGGLWPVAYGILGIEVMVGLVLTISFTARPGAPTTFLALSVLLGYLMFTAVMLLVIADRNRRTRAERELKRWSVMLEQLVKSPQKRTDSPETALTTLLETLQPSFPELRGISATTERPPNLNLLSVGKVTSYARPLIADGAEVGQLYFRAAPERSAGDLSGGRLGQPDILDALLPLVAVQVERTLSYAHLHVQALTDPLTNLHNRRSFALRGSNLAHLACRRELPLSVVVLDIDHFKRVNDVYRHPVGDEALQKVAEVLRRNTRSEDHAVRWGGEEFVLLLFDTTLAQTLVVVQRIRLELKGTFVPPIAWPLTVSAGIAGGDVPVGEESLQHWLGAADGALLRPNRPGVTELRSQHLRALTKHAEQKDQKAHSQKRKTQQDVNARVVFARYDIFVACAVSNAVTQKNQTRCQQQCAHHRIEMPHLSSCAYCRAQGPIKQRVDTDLAGSAGEAIAGIIWEQTLSPLFEPSYTHILK